MKKLVVGSLLLLVLVGVGLAQERAKGLNFSVGGGLQGGAGVVGINLILPFSPRPDVELKAQAGYGIGNNYNLMLAKGVVVLKLKEPLFLEGAVDYANYSTKVTGILGLGDIDKGAKVGIGIALGRDFDRFSAKVGYSLALGLVAGIEYKF